MMKLTTLLLFCQMHIIRLRYCDFAFFPFQDVLNNLGSSELDEDDLMLDLDLSDDQRHRHGNFIASFIKSVSQVCS